MSPAAQARSVSGRNRSSRPRRTRRWAAFFGTRQRAVIQAAAVWAPSAAQSPAASKEAVARVATASRVARWR